MEIGSFIELEFPKGKEKYKGCQDIARLNTGRAGIYHAARILGCDTLYVPLYQCESVQEFLRRKGITVKQYIQDDNYNPLIENVEGNACVLLVNYFGIMSKSRMQFLANKYPCVIIDNAQGFFAEPLENCMCVYSARKFVGVPDGAYVIGKHAEMLCEEYEQGYSSDTSLFLLQRHEYGCEGKTYESRKLNELRIDKEDIKLMSELTHHILDGTDYDSIALKRRGNFDIAHELFGGLNEMDPLQYYDNSCVPMVYPLYVSDENLLSRLLKAKHFQGHWWNYITKISKPEQFEYRMSKFMVPITIDQRYGKEELKYIRGLI